MPLARRQELAKIAKQAGLLLLEDDPYAALSYSGDALPTLLSMMPDQVVHMGSFSKVLAPGLRVGYVIAPPEPCIASWCRRSRLRTCTRRASRNASSTRP